MVGDGHRKGGRPPPPGPDAAGGARRGCRSCRHHALRRRGHSDACQRPDERRLADALIRMPTAEGHAQEDRQPCEPPGRCPADPPGAARRHPARHRPLGTPIENRTSAAAGTPTATRTPGDQSSSTAPTVLGPMPTSQARSGGRGGARRPGRRRQTGERRPQDPALRPAERRSLPCSGQHHEEQGQRTRCPVGTRGDDRDRDQENRAAHRAWSPPPIAARLGARAHARDQSSQEPDVRLRRGNEVPVAIPQRGRPVPSDPGTTAPT
jgi:hypothetical protein